MTGSVTRVSLSNPYRVGVPIRDPQGFYGRVEQLREAFEHIGKMGCVNVVGERRSGKTSLLFQMGQPEVRARYGADDPAALYVYLDAEICPQTPSGFFREVLTQIAVQRPDLADRLPGVTTWETGPPAEAEHEPSTTDERLMREALQALASSQAPGPRRLVLLIDEFERIAQSRGFAPRFFVFLRGLSINYGVSYVVTTARLLPDCCPYEVVSSPFPNIFRTVRLGPLTREAYEAFIRGTTLPGGPPMVEIQDEIADMAGYMPYLVQMACWHAFQTWQESGGSWEGALPIVRRRFEEDARPHFNAVWERYLSQEERQALRALVEGGKPFPDQATLLASAETPRVLRELARKGYIGSSVFAEFVRRQDSQERPTTQPVPPSQGVYVDEASGNIFVEGKLVDPPLPKHQYLLLKLLFDNVGKICNAYMVVEAVWSEDYMDQVDDQRIAQLIRRLRQRIEPEGKPWRYILTVRGRGLTLGDGRPQGERRPA